VDSLPSGQHYKPAQKHFVDIFPLSRWAHLTRVGLFLRRIFRGARFDVGITGPSRVLFFRTRTRWSEKGPKKIILRVGPGQLLRFVRTCIR
jgi:hypothetical protein